MYNMGMKKTTIVFLLISLVSLCIYAEDFTLGIYGVNNPDDIKIVKAAGFNTIQTYVKDTEKIQALAEEAIKQNIKLVACPDDFLKKFDKKTYIDMPIKAWYLFDEPDVHNLSWDTLNDLDVKTKHFFPNDKTVFVIGQGKTDTSFYDIADILMVDWYPVPHLELESFGDQIAIAKNELAKAVVKDKPLWAVVQMFDWREYKQYRPDTDRIGRFPTKDEIRFMSYDALFNGANGLFYFIYTSKEKPLPQAKPEAWSYIKEIVSELAFTTKILSKGTELEIDEIESPFLAKSYSFEEETYIFLINRSDQFVKLPKIFRKSNLSVLFNQKTKFKKILKKYTVPPYSVWIIKKDR